MSKQIHTTLGNFYAYSKEVLKALQTLESFMNDKEFRTFAEKMKKTRIPLSISFRTRRDLLNRLILQNTF